VFFERLNLDSDGFFLKGLPLGALVLAALMLVPTWTGSTKAAPAPAAMAFGLRVELALKHSLRVAQRLRQPRIPQKTIVHPPAPRKVSIPPGGGVLHKIAFASNRADGRHLQIYMMDADGEQVERLTHSEAFDRDPHLAYDGSQLVFSSNREGAYQIYSLDLATRAERRLTNGPMDKTNPFWSPDQRHLLYTVHEGERSQVVIMDADGSRPRVIPQAPGHAHGYGFSSDGNRVTIEWSGDQEQAICVYHLRTGRTEKMFNQLDAVYGADPVFSPIANRLVFSANLVERRTRQLYIYDLDVGRFFRITDDQTDKDDPIFSPDGSMVAYIAKWENAWNIFTMRADGTQQKNLTRSHFDHSVPSWR
jgi:TolB protein